MTLHVGSAWRKIYFHILPVCECPVLGGKRRFFGVPFAESEKNTHVAQSPIDCIIKFIENTGLIGQHTSWEVLGAHEAEAPVKWNNN